MTVDIRILTEADAALFQALRLRGLREAPAAFSSSYEEECDRSLDEVRPRLQSSRESAVFGAVVGDELAGVVGIRREKPRKLAHRAVLWGMYVAPEHRKLKIGRALVERALQYAAETIGARQVVLGVGANNSAAIALYERVGFESFGIERDYIFAAREYHDEMHMLRFLQ